MDVGNIVDLRDNVDHQLCELHQLEVGDAAPQPEEATEREKCDAIVPTKWSLGEGKQKPKIAAGGEP